MLQETTAVLDSLRESWAQIARFVPRLVIALLLLVAGWLVARAARRAVIVVGRFLRLDRLAENTGVEDFLVRGGVPLTTVSLLGGAVYWLVLFATFDALLNMLGIVAGPELSNRVAVFLPNLILAIVIVMFGSVVAKFVGSLVATYLNNVGSAAAEPLAAVARYAVLLFVLAMAAEQLALRTEVLVSGFQIAFGALCFGFALAFGLGGRQWAARILEKHWKK